ncbi:MAG: C4-type zinc ribbon domain-containing protein [Deltaproteobacteria bacterium]|jgi:predicted  nucleic acid-binding Zn-ribbon protein|nr:C4-type zinc ribbon domain-containing protein [Deltaproteobacteria bacterium]
MEDTIVKFLAAQEIEAEAAKLKETLRSAPPKIAALDAELEKLKEELEDRKREIALAEERARVLDLDLKKLKALNESNIVRGKKSRNQREYKAFEKDQKTIETRTRETEEKYLSEMAGIEEMNGVLKALEEAFPEKEGAVSSSRTELERELREAERRVEESDLAVEAILKDIPGESARIYRKAAEGRPGRALAAVENSTCLACHMNIPPQLYNELYKNDRIRLCPHCHRVMYIRKNPAFGYVPEEAPEEPEKKGKKGKGRGGSPKSGRAALGDRS